MRATLPHGHHLLTLPGLAQSRKLSWVFKWKRLSCWEFLVVVAWLKPRSSHSCWVSLWARRNCKAVCLKPLAPFGSSNDELSNLSLDSHEMPDLAFSLTRPCPSYRTGLVRKSSKEQRFFAHEFGHRARNWSKHVKTKPVWLVQESIERAFGWFILWLLKPDRSQLWGSCVRR